MSTCLRSWSAGGEGKVRRTEHLAQSSPTFLPALRGGVAWKVEPGCQQLAAPCSLALGAGATLRSGAQPWPGSGIGALSQSILSLHHWLMAQSGGLLGSCFSETGFSWISLEEVPVPVLPPTPTKPTLNGMESNYIILLCETDKQCIKVQSRAGTWAIHILQKCFLCYWVMPALWMWRWCFH